MSHIRTKGITGASGIPITDEMIVMIDHALSPGQRAKTRARLTEREWHTLTNVRAAISEEFARIASQRTTFAKTLKRKTKGRR